jgi:hypothetical protein
MKGPEFAIHVAILEWIRAVAPSLLPFHPANGGLRTASEAQALKRMGVVPGIPDIVILAPGGSVYLIEVKPPGGELSKDQRAINERFLEMGIPHCVCRSIEDARIALKNWNLTTREAT